MSTSQAATSNGRDRFPANYKDLDIGKLSRHGGGSTTTCPFDGQRQRDFSNVSKNLTESRSRIIWLEQRQVNLRRERINVPLQVAERLHVVIRIFLRRSLSRKAMSARSGSPNYRGTMTQKQRLHDEMLGRELSVLSLFLLLLSFRSLAECKNRRWRDRLFVVPGHNNRIVFRKPSSAAMIV